MRSTVGVVDLEDNVLGLPDSAESHTYTLTVAEDGLGQEDADIAGRLVLALVDRLGEGGFYGEDW